MKSSPTRRVLVAAVGVAALAVPLAACSSSGGGDDAGSSTEISFLTQNVEQNITAAEALIKAFEADNPDITVKLETQPAGTEGDNLIKTKLSTGEMEDVFYYNSGSLFQAMNPDQTLVDLSDQDWVDGLIDAMLPTVSTDNGLYGAPFGATQAGAVLYNKKIYADLGLEVPKDWAEFEANNEAIAAAGLTPVIQTYGDTWTSQLFVLGDFGNVLKQDPNWADDYTNNKAKYVDEPGIQGFANQQEGFEKGWWNEDFASAVLDDGIKMIATGEGAHYPMLTGVVSSISQNYPDNIEDVGVFPLPAQNADDTTLTVWLPNAVYIPKTTEGAKLEAAKKFVAFLNSPGGCEIQTTVMVPSGPFATSACSLPDSVPGLLKDMQPYFDAGQTNPALEFLSPIKGPNLENITVEVGSGIRSADDGAALYDEDVVKQAQQLGLEGW